MLTDGFDFSSMLPTPLEVMAIREALEAGLLGFPSHAVRAARDDGVTIEQVLNVVRVGIPIQKDFPDHQSRTAGISFEGRAGGSRRVRVQRFSPSLRKKRAFFPTPVPPLSHFYSCYSPLIENLGILNQSEICYNSFLERLLLRGDGAFSKTHPAQDSEVNHENDQVRVRPEAHKARRDRP